MIGKFARADAGSNKTGQGSARKEEEFYGIRAQTPLDANWNGNWAGFWREALPEGALTQKSFSRGIAFGQPKRTVGSRGSAYNSATPLPKTIRSRPINGIRDPWAGEKSRESKYLAEDRGRKPDSRLERVST